MKNLKTIWKSFFRSSFSRCLTPFFPDVPSNFQKSFQTFLPTSRKSIADPIHEWASGEIITFIATVMKCGLAMGNVQCTWSGIVLWIGGIQFARIRSTAVAKSTDSHHCVLAFHLLVPLPAQIVEWWRTGKCMVIPCYEGARSERCTSPTDEWLWLLGALGPVSHQTG